MQSILNLIKVMFFSVAVQGGTDYSTITTCSNLPKVPFQPQEMIALSPFTVFASINPYYQCSQNVHTNPSVTNATYSYSVINKQTNPQGYNFIPTDITLSSDNLSAIITYCSNGTNQTVHMLESNLTGGNSYTCIYECAPSNPAIIGAFLCDGRTQDDQTAITSIVNSLKNLFGTSQVTVTSAPATGCSSGQFCPLF